MASTPDYAGPLCGWRAWFLVECEQGLLLRSVIYETLWPRRRALLAECLSTARGGSHPAPSESCRCGIYAACAPARAAQLLERCGHHLRGESGRVVGRVFLWGEVVECEAGWRAACAYPAQLYLLGDGDPLAVVERARALAGYGVPVETLEARSREDVFAVLARAGAAAG